MASFFNFMNYGGYPGGMMNGWSGSGMGLFGLLMAPIVLVLLLWTLYWKYQAIWYAVKHDHKWWFLALLVVNTLGILEILYLYVFSKNMETSAHSEKNVPMVPPQQ